MKIAAFKITINGNIVEDRAEIEEATDIVEDIVMNFILAERDRITKLYTEFAGVENVWIDYDLD